MSRVSIANRIARIREHYRPRETLAGRIDRLSAEYRVFVQSWHEWNRRIISAISERDGPGAAYELYLAGELHQFEQLPHEITRALWPEWPDLHGDDPAHIYNELVSGE